VSTGNDELVRTSFDAFLAGDWEALSRIMAPDVQWLWHEPGDWDCHDRRKVLSTLFERQREGVVTGLNRVVAVDDRVFVEVTGPRLTEWGLPRGRACMVVTVREGRIVRMQDYPNRAAALAGAGLPPEPVDDTEPEDDLTADPPLLRADGPMARKVTEVIHRGDAAALAALLREHATLARARIGDPLRGQSRTLLHVLTDWPGHFPDAAAKVAALVAAGADVNARFTGPHGETPLHWAASSDDIDALDALLDAGADIEADGAVIAGGTAMADAVAFGQWNVARRLLERGAHTNLWQAAALGLADRVRDELTGTPPPAREDLDNALWCAAHGGQRQTAELLLDRGADAAWVGHDNLTPAQAAERSEAHELAAWLRQQSPRNPSPPRP
jgi:ketosteroid isomerase-like protein